MRAVVTTFAFALTLAVGATIAAEKTASASPDTFGVGDGHTGALAVRDPGQIVNKYALLSANVAIGEKKLAIAVTTDFAKGDLVLVHRTHGLPRVKSGDQTLIDLSASPVGRWELARVASVEAAALVLETPMLTEFDRAGSQVVKVPEYSRLQIEKGGTIVAPRYDGKVGGVLVFLVRDELTNDGILSASGSGFRGGAISNGKVSDLGCTGLDILPPRAGGKGEGLTDRFGPRTGGRGNTANGAGGGDCHNAGGGGGANAGAGGKGGRSFTEDGSRDVGGLGGAPIKLALLDRLTFGGGGGAGHEDDMVGTAGGAGGGIVFVRAGSLLGAGTISADGQGAFGAGTDGAGGGGAGGSVLVRTGGAAKCGTIFARGGVGGDAAAGFGPGGGGGGGRVLLQSGAGTVCPVDVSAGAAGNQPDATSPYGKTYGAGPTDPKVAPFVGVVEAPPTTPICTSDAHCKAPTPRCDLSRLICVECLTNLDCPAAKSVCDPTARACRACANDAECGSPTSGKVCSDPTSPAPLCIDGCRGTGGNGCPAGLVCTSTTAAVGRCVLGPDAGGSDGGVEGGAGGAAGAGGAGRGDASAPDGSPDTSGTTVPGTPTPVDQAERLEGGGVSCGVSSAGAEGRRAAAMSSIGLVGLVGLAGALRRRRLPRR